VEAQGPPTYLMGQIETSAGVFTTLVWTSCALSSAGVLRPKKTGRYRSARHLPTEDRRLIRSVSNTQELRI
jgi:hypothetical protein